MSSTGLLAFSLTSGIGLVIPIAGAITVIGGAAAILLHSGKAAARWWKPRPPLVSFGHPSETVAPFFFGWGDSDADWEQQNQRWEELRLKSLEISYLIENKDQAAVRELSTGIRARDGSVNWTHEPCFVQILAPTERVEITDLAPPEEMWKGMTDSDRSTNFVYWTRFLDESGRRWEVTYDPQTRKMTNRLPNRRFVGAGTDGSA